jgi:hypothetical protein
MFFAYIFQFMFVTLCYLANVPDPYDHISEWRRRPTRTASHIFSHPFPPKILALWRQNNIIIKRITDTFLDAATFFALAIAVTALIYMFRRNTTLYEKLLIVYVCYSNLFGLYIILCFSYKNLRRRRLRVGLVSLCSTTIYAMWIVRHINSSSDFRSPMCKGELDMMGTWDFVTIPHIVAFMEFSGHSITIGKWACAKFSKQQKQRDLIELQLHNLLSDVGIFEFLNTLGMLLSMIYSCLCGLPPASDLAVARALRARGAFQSLLRWLVATVCLSLSWFLAASFFCARRKSQEYGGNANKDNEFGFGQILAFLAWLPVVVEYVYFTHCRSLIPASCLLLMKSNR